MPQSAIRLQQRGVLKIEGPDARDFLQNIITNDINKVMPDQAVYAALLTPQGKYLFDFFIAVHGEALLLDCEKDRKDDLLRRLMLYRLRAKADIADISDNYTVWAGISALPDGVAVTDKTGSAAPYDGGILFRDPRTSDMGWRAILPAESTALTDGGPALQAAYETRRIALGLPDGSRDMEPEKTLALEGCLDHLNAIDFKKGCYVGQELTARTKHRGKIRRRLMPVTVDGGAPDAGSDIVKNDKVIGTLRSGLNDRALALLRIEELDGGDITTNGRAIHVHSPKWLDA